MTIPEIITLTAKGYKPAEIKEISTLAAASDDIIELAKACDGIEDLRALIELSSTSPEPGSEKVEQPAEAAESVPTPPEENESIRKELEAVRAELKAAQKANAARDNSGNEIKVEDTLADIMRSCY